MGGITRPTPSPDTNKENGVNRGNGMSISKNKHTHYVLPLTKSPKVLKAMKDSMNYVAKIKFLWYSMVDQVFESTYRLGVLEKDAVNTLGLLGMYKFTIVNSDQEIGKALKM